MSHVFISYVRESSAIVDRLASDLETLGVTVWVDRQRIRPGQRWRSAIRDATRSGTLFVACFSPAYATRHKSYMNEELTLAIDELRQRLSDRAWFIPVILEGGHVPARPISSYETLADIQHIDLSVDWSGGVHAIAHAAQTTSPSVQHQEPLTSTPRTRAGAFVQILAEKDLNPYPHIRDFLFDQLDAAFFRHREKGLIPRVAVAEAIAAAEERFGEDAYSWSDVERVIAWLIRSESVLKDDFPEAGGSVRFSGRGLATSLSSNWRLALEFQFLLVLVTAGFRMTIMDIPALAEALYGDNSAVGQQRVDKLIQWALQTRRIQVDGSGAHVIVAGSAG
jgi:hypothetical protein